MFQQSRSLVCASPAPRRFAHAVRALACLTFGGWLVAPVSGHAADGRAEIFTVREVAVDATAVTAAAAREQALATGQRLGFQRLLARLTPRRDADRLPKPDGNELVDLVEGFEVQQEKTSAVRYIATLTYHFKPNGIERLLRASGIDFAETPSKPVLVLPVLRSAGAAVLWEEPNPWRAGWSNLPASDALVPFVVPLGDLEDIADIDAEQAVKGDVEKLRAIATRYGAGSVLVAIATPRGGGGEAPSAVDLAASRYGTGIDDPTSVSSVAALRGETLDALLTRAARPLEDELAERWKEQNLLHFDQVQQAIITVPIGGLEHWVEVRRRLEQIAFISRAQLVYLSRSEARIDISYLGARAQLAQALAQRDLTLAEENGGLVLRLTAAAAADRGGRAPTEPNGSGPAPDQVGRPPADSTATQ